MDRLLLARLNPSDCSNTVGQGKAARPRTQESPDEQQYHCCFCHQCPRALPAQQSLGQVPLAGEPRRRKAVKSSFRRAASIRLRLAEHFSSIAMTFLLTSSRFSKEPWHSRVVVSRKHQHQQQHAPTAVSATNASTKITHTATSNTTSCARLVVATRPVRPSRWSATTLVTKAARYHNTRFRNTFHRSEPAPSPQADSPDSPPLHRGSFSSASTKRSSLQQPRVPLLSPIVCIGAKITDAFQPAPSNAATILKPCECRRKLCAALVNGPAKAA